MWDFLDFDYGGDWSNALDYDSYTDFFDSDYSAWTDTGNWLGDGYGYDYGLDYGGNWWDNALDYGSYTDFFDPVAEPGIWDSLVGGVRNVAGGLGLSPAQLIGGGVGLAGGIAGSGPQQSTQQQRLDPRMEPYIYGPEGILGEAHEWFENNRGGNELMRQGAQRQGDFYNSPEYTQGFNQLRDMGLGLLGGGIAGNPFTGGQTTTMPAPRSVTPTPAPQSTTPTAQPTPHTQINDLYRSILGRDVDPSGLSTYSNYLSNGGNLSGLSGILLGSDEYRSRQPTPTAPGGQQNSLIPPTGTQPSWGEWDYFRTTPRTPPRAYAA